MARVEYYRDSAAPGADDLLPAAFAVVRDAAGRVLLVRRADDGNWELPGGRVDVGESATTAVIREVAEEAGIAILITAVSGVYTDPTHVLAGPHEQVYQQFAVCFHATIRGSGSNSGDVRPDYTETTAAGVSVAGVNTLMCGGRHGGVREWKTGVRTEGITYATFSFTRKVGQAVGGAVAAYAIAFGGYVGGTPQQSESALAWISAAAGFLPAPFTLLGVVIFLGNPLTDQRFAELVAETRARREAAYAAGRGDTGITAWRSDRLDSSRPK